MSEQSEQERLARLIGGEGFDPSQSGDMIAESLKNALGGVSMKHYEQVQEEIVSSEENGTSSKVSSKKIALSTNVNAEKVLINLFGVYDSLIEIFQSVGIDGSISEEITRNIWTIEKCISDIGGQVDHFIPEDFVSGLTAPDILINAIKTIDTTKKCYRLGEIKNDQVSKDGKTISIEFHGVSNDNVEYTAKGTIQSKSGWVGNEAIDYIYKSGGGKMTVKAFMEGKWINQSKNYDIHWELEEIDTSEGTPDDNGTTASGEIAEEFSRAIKEETSNSQNNSNDGENFNVITKND